ncbi:YeeE/YedE family protein [Bradyrhizobium retamae]|uniref:YeeE/YedE family protein n=1 Tax=Bradyrhizobium retamae TaxID=1300035 RepID=UPI000ABC5FB7|nr:YeeE/YedE family protein [Bradyrhizobium retamae]
MASEALTSQDKAYAHRIDAPQTATAPGSPASFAFVPSLVRLLVSAALLVVLAALAYVLHLNRQPGLSLSLLLGAAFGIVLQRSRFCFFCNFRDWFDSGDPRGLFGILVALAVGIVGYAIVFGAWLPDPSSGRLPPDAFIGPVSLVLPVAGLAFGAGMAISGSCVSAHLYRLGEGSPTAPFALIGTVIGFILGFMSWNTLYLTQIVGAPMVWLPHWVGYAGTLVASLIMLALVALWLSRGGQQRSQPVDDTPWRKILIHRWPAWIGGAIVGVIGMVAYLRVAPLGVTAEIGSRARQIASVTGLSPGRLEGLDTLRGCVTVIRDGLVSNNGAFIAALVVASFAAAFVSGQFKPERPTAGQASRGVIGGILLGWGAMTGLGCTIGTLLSGIMAGALSGWVFAVAVFTGIATTLLVGRRIGALG